MSRRGSDLRLPAAERRGEHTTSTESNFVAQKLIKWSNSRHRPDCLLSLSLEQINKLISFFFVTPNRPRMRSGTFHNSAISIPEINPSAKRKTNTNAKRKHRRPFSKLDFEFSFNSSMGFCRSARCTDLRLDCLVSESCTQPFEYQTQSAR